jgi:hypothetical protein
MSMKIPHQWNGSQASRMAFRVELLRRNTRPKIRISAPSQRCIRTQGRTAGQSMSAVPNRPSAAPGTISINGHHVPQSAPTRNITATVLTTSPAPVIQSATALRHPRTNARIAPVPRKTHPGKRMNSDHQLLSGTRVRMPSSAPADRNINPAATGTVRGIFSGDFRAGGRVIGNLPSGKGYPEEGGAAYPPANSSLTAGHNRKRESKKKAICDSSVSSPHPMLLPTYAGERWPNLSPSKATGGRMGEGKEAPFSMEFWWISIGPNNCR